MGPGLRRDDINLEAALLPELRHFVIAYKFAALGLLESFKHGGAMRLGTTNRSLSASAICSNISAT